jgi:hypothetical protein
MAVHHAFINKLDLDNHKAYLSVITNQLVGTTITMLDNCFTNPGELLVSDYTSAIYGNYNVVNFIINLSRLSSAIDMLVSHNFTFTNNNIY